MKLAKQSESLAGGKLTASLLEKAASNPKHSLHKEFVWDDQIAGHKYRLIQARQIIRSVQIDIQLHNHIISVVRYVRDPNLPVRQEGYKCLSTVERRSEEARAIMLMYLDRVESLIRSAREVAITLGLSNELQALLAQLVVLRTKSDDEAA